MSVYRLPSPYERPPLRRRLSGIALAVAINAGLLLLLFTLGRLAPEVHTVSGATIVDFLPESHSAAAPSSSQSKAKAVAQRRSAPVSTVKPPPVLIPSKRTIAEPPRASQQPWIEMSSNDLASADVRNLTKGSDGSGSAGDSEVAGTGPHGETLYAAEWARHPTDAELGGYLPASAPDGYGLIACRTVAGDRVTDCVELAQEPRGSRLASAVRQAAWQFRIRPPRKNGVPLVGSWVSIRIDYEGRDRSGRRGL